MLTVAMVRRKLPDTVADPEPAIAATTGRLLTGRPVRTRVLRTTILWCVLTLLARPAVAQVDQQRAQEFFKEAQALCERDGGRLWGVSLCGPMVVGDMRTQTMATSQAAPEGARPQVVGLVNAPLEWGGATWGAYVWDFMVMGTPRFRKELMLHE